MPFLGDYLGQILSEISMARTQADLETLRLAELYAAHPLLRSMPVPHVRLPEVDLDIPVLIKASGEAKPGESTRGSVNPQLMIKRFEEVLISHLLKEKIDLPPAQRAELKNAVDKRMSTGAPQEVSVDVRHIADDLAALAVRHVPLLGTKSENKEDPTPTESARDLKETLRTEFLRLRSAPPRLNVLVTSAELREGGTPDNMTRLRLKVTEESLEWITTETNGTQKGRLVPE